jgi:hypothetical protein
VFSALIGLATVLGAAAPAGMLVSIYAAPRTFFCADILAALTGAACSDARRRERPLRACGRALRRGPDRPKRLQLWLHAEGRRERV